MKDYIPFDWNCIEDKAKWLDPCEESWYYAEKWKREGRKHVLDLGCGLGRHSVLFAKYGFEVTAVDVSDEALSFLRSYSEEQGVADRIDCRKADMEEMPFAADSFDCLFSMHAAGHTDTEGMNRTMQEIRRFMKPGGEVFMTLCSKETQTYLDPDLPRLDENTVVKTEGPEQSVPHFFIDIEGIKTLFAGFELKKIRHIDECFSDGVWRDQKSYFIEADLR